MEAQPLRTWRLCPKEGLVRGMAEGAEAVRQAVYLALNTERYDWPVYSAEYGAELRGLIGQPEAWVLPEAERRIREALMADARVAAVRDFAFEREEAGRLAVRFVVETAAGAVDARTVLEV